MTIQITMTQTRQGDAGAVLLAGSTYTVRKELGQALIGAKYATDTANALVPAPSTFSQAQVTALQGVVSGAGILWANRPDVVANSGLLIYVTDIGRGVLLRSDGVSWRPMGGRQMLYHRTALLAAPIATVVSGAAVTFSALPESLVLPAGLVALGGSVEIEAWFSRLVATGTAYNVFSYLGNLNTSVDPVAGFVSLSNVVSGQGRIAAEARFVSATSYLRSGSVPPGGSATGGFADNTTNAATASPLYVNFGIGATTGGDTLSLLAYSITLRG